MPGLPEHRQPNVAPQQVVGTMRHVHDAHHAKNERQPASEQKQQRAIRDAVEELSNPQFHVQHPWLGAGITIAPCPS